MFIGHFGAAFGAKTLAPEVSLGTLFLAAQFPDLLWSTLLLLGVGLHRAHAVSVFYDGYVLSHRCI